MRPASVRNLAFLLLVAAALTAVPTAFAAGPGPDVSEGPLIPYRDRAEAASPLIPYRLPLLHGTETAEKSAPKPARQ